MGRAVGDKNVHLPGGEIVSGESNEEFPHEVRVKVTGFRKYKGYSDLVETYCCSSTPEYYVVFPAIGGIKGTGNLLTEFRNFVRIP
jgi:hypothetical protein